MGDPEKLGLKHLKKSNKFQIQDGDEFIADMSDIIDILPYQVIHDGIDGYNNYMFEKVINVVEM